MTNLEDALVAVEAGADAVGFVFYEKSPRNVSVETTRQIVQALPESVEKVGVFVGASSEAVIKVSDTARLTAAQLYPGADGQFFPLCEEFFRNVGCDVIVACSMRQLEFLKEKDSTGFFLSSGVMNRIHAMLVDSGDSQRPGGTGKKFAWDRGAQFFCDGWKQLGVRLIVAGGMTPENVPEALGIFEPWGVDVSSGVEASPGKKDPEKVRAFVRAVREYDRRIG